MLAGDGSKLTVPPRGCAECFVSGGSSLYDRRVSFCIPITNDGAGFVVGPKHLLLLGDSGMCEGQRSG